MNHDDDFADELKNRLVDLAAFLETGGAEDAVIVLHANRINHPDGTIQRQPGVLAVVYDTTATKGGRAMIRNRPTETGSLLGIEDRPLSSDDPPRVSIEVDGISEQVGDECRIITFFPVSSET